MISGLNPGLKKSLIKPLTSVRFLLVLVIVDKKGSMPERLMGADCKSAGYAYAGSNPARPTTIHSKFKVNGQKIMTD